MKSLLNVRISASFVVALALSISGSALGQQIYNGNGFQQQGAYPAQQAYGQQAYGQPAYGQPAYGQPQYGQQQQFNQQQYGVPSRQFGQPVQGQQYGQQQYGQPAQQYGQPAQQYGQPYQNGQLPQTFTSASWTQKISFVKREHDFGACPKGSKQECVFEFENNQDSDIELLGVRASCGCTKPEVITQIVKPGETAKVLARFDTFFKPGPKQATVTVSVKKKATAAPGSYEQFGEVQFAVRGKIRQDVVVNPGKIQFEAIPPATEAQRTVAVMYAGDPRWQVLDVKSSNPNITIEKVEKRRDTNTGRVDYELIVRLADTQQIGLFSEQLTLITNDVNTPQMNVSVEGHVKSLLESSPVKLGMISKDEDVVRKMVLRGAEAFEIKEVQVGNQKIKFTDTSEGRRSTLHVLTYELDTETPGLINSEVTIVSDLPGQAEVKVPFSANIVQRTATNN